MNTIETVTKYLPLLDEQYRLESKSAILDTPSEFVQMTKEAKKFKVAKITTDKLADYSRNGGFVDGDTDLDWEEHEFTVDRGRSLQIDVMDNQETFGLAFGRLAGTFQRDAVIPEMDAIRFSKYYGYAGIKKNVALTVNNVFSIVDDITEYQDDNEVPESGKVIFANPHTYKLMMNEANMTKFLCVDDGTSKALNKKIHSYNDMPIIKVPSNRFYSKIQLLDGKSEGQKAGGYKCAADGEVIGFMVISKDSVIQISKRAISRFWAPTRAEMDANRADGVNPNADAWKFDFRVYHDAWVLDNKTNGLAAVIDLPTITVNATASVKVGASVDLGVEYTGGARPTYSSGTPAKATVDANGFVTGLEAGQSVITIKAGSVTKTVTVTVSN